ncbi:hypothetical protein [Vulcanisaeta distributa]|uniref:Uncharacterized protein n=1 Tax=Vulcanisaeta distributa (strain DSM 14429 / JCM 11212 / NBRC 100878 / IC-017) TaxID=572478 RepID=E1QSX2_VULDI|nr:hypothetical protein [Vulcanisaeta distributa]ADN50839.1 conserved hypothetical protein [Vulcanisaeta distributa DSM 14429]
MSEGEEEFIPHAIHMWFGYLKDRIVTKEEGAKHSRFSKDAENRLREALSTFGWVYCIDCKHPIFDLEEALEHLRRGHVLTNRFMPDEVAPEEVPMVS